MFRTWVIIVFLSLVLGAGTAQAAQDGTLELSGAWYRLVAPWRYDEVHQYAAGWRRAALVMPTDGRVRAPVRGVVRWRGRVAGREVVTIVTGQPVTRRVITVTGLDSVLAGVRAGARLDVGDELGHARTVQVGMYDVARRSRYHPVVVASAALPTLATSGAAVGSSVGAGLGSAVGRRLEQLVDGDLAGAALDGLVVSTASLANGGRSPGSPVLVPNAGPGAGLGGTGRRGAAVKPLSRSTAPATSRGNPDFTHSAGGHGGTNASAGFVGRSLHWSREVAGRRFGAPTAREAGLAGDTVRSRRSREEDSVNTVTGLPIGGSPMGPVRAWHVPMPSGWPRSGASVVASSAKSEGGDSVPSATSVAQRTPLEPRRTVARVADRFNGARVAWLLTLLAVITAWWRARRRVHLLREEAFDASDAPTLELPAVLLPTVAPVHPMTSMRRMEPIDEALAWSDADPGTSDGSHDRTHGRTPEHA